MKPIYNNLYQFTTYIPQMDFTIHQYLLKSNPAILFAAGTVQQAEHILPYIKEILQEEELKYIFVSHIESDECGGISIFLKEYPKVKVICSNLGARELPGYGYQGELVVGIQDKPIVDEGIELRFFDYPSEVHLQNGLVCYEKNSGIFYSADLILQYGNAGGKTVVSDWNQAVDNISAQFEELKNNLKDITPSFVAVGHGFCVELK